MTKIHYRAIFFADTLAHDPTPTMAQLQNVYGEHYFIHKDLYYRHSDILKDQYIAVVPSGRSGASLRRFIVTLVEVVQVNLNFYPTITTIPVLLTERGNCVEWTAS
ncbi:MAG: hypothetical protein GY816_12120 [Cytophagales bacterium]|nr:hypothetical protein [Cytophagales bacterium]